MYGSKATLYLEELLASGAELIIDLGDYKKGIAEDLDALESQIGIPVIFIEANLDNMASAYRTLGKVLSMEERGEETVPVSLYRRSSSLVSYLSGREKENEYQPDDEVEGGVGYFLTKPSPVCEVSELYVPDKN